MDQNHSMRIAKSWQKQAGAQLWTCSPRFGNNRIEEPTFCAYNKSCPNMGLPPGRPAKSTSAPGKNIVVGATC